MLALLLLALQDAPVEIKVVDAENARPIFARVVLRDAAGALVGSCGYKFLPGRFVPPEGYKVTLPPGRYRLEGVPLAAHLLFSHGGKSVSKTILFDDPKVREIHHKIYSTDFVGTPGALGGCFPPDFFSLLRNITRDCTIDAEIDK